MAFFPTSSSVLGLHPAQGSIADYPLTDAKVHYDLSDVQMLANLVQTYTSNATVATEIRYIFPLPPDASICSFKAVIDGKRTIQGVVKEKAKAEAEYEQAVTHGKTAALLQQGTVEIFQVSLGNIRPQQTIEVRISFVCIVAHDGSLDSLRLNFPCAIAPRYGTSSSGMFGSSLPAWGSSGSSRSALDFSVAIDMTSQIKSITSPSHPIAVKLGETTLHSSSEFDPKKARVSLSSPAFLEKDIVIVLTCQGLDKPRCMVESFSPEEGGQEYTVAYALTLVPRFELPSLPSQEYIFLVDRSGSMGGGKMEAVRSALQIMLVSLPARGTSLNIISFGHRHTLLWPRSVAYSADSVKTASSHVDSMSSNYGGTEIRSAIEAAFASRSSNPEVQNTPTSLFVLTDGQASDLDGVQSSIQQAVAKAKADNVLLRVFCMGIGDAVSKAMCDTIARAGQGAAAFVGEREKPDQKLMGLLRAARGGVVEDVSIDFGVDEHDPAKEDSQDFEIVSAQDGSPEPPKEATPISLFDESHTASERPDLGPQAVASIKLPPPPNIQQAPPSNSLPPLYPGFRTSIFAIVRRSGVGNPASQKTLRVKGSVLGRPVVLEVPISLVSKPEAPTSTGLKQTKMLHVIAARALVQSFEDKATGVKSDVDSAEVLRLAVRYGLASSQTSFLAVDEQGAPVDVVQTPKVGAQIATVVFQTARAGTHASSGLFGALGATPTPQQAFGAYAAPSALSTPTGQFTAAPPLLGMGLPRSSSSRSFIPSQARGRGGQQMQAGYVGMAHSQPPPGSFFGGSPATSSFLPGSSAFGSLREPENSASSALPPTIESFARAQSFDGSFVGSPALFQLLVQQPKAPTMPRVLGTPNTLRTTTWCTLLCVVYLETKFLDKKDVWAMIVEKAMAWVEDTLGNVAGAARVAALGQELKDEARKCIV